MFISMEQGIVIADGVQGRWRAFVQGAFSQGHLLHDWLYKITHVVGNHSNHEHRR